MNPSERDRIREVYTHRELSTNKMLYSPFDHAHHLLHFSRQRAFLRILQDHGIHTLDKVRILEVGCGAGEILLEYMGYGASPSNLFGFDFLLPQLVEGKNCAGKVHWLCADGRYIPFVSGSFDLVVQHTVLSSVLDTGFRERIASEMLRVVKPDGLIVSYDFWPDNPRNRNVRGVKKKDLDRLFPGCGIRVRRTVLAPPLSRRVAPVSHAASVLLEAIPWVCSHYMAGITPPRNVLSRGVKRGNAVLGASFSGKEDVVIRAATRSDIDAIVAIHMDSFENFFLSFLGPRFLRVLYESLIEDPDGVFILGVSGEKIVGFAAGTMRQESYYKRVIAKRIGRFAMASLGAIFREPSTVRRLVRALRYPKLAQKASAGACLMSIAVRTGTWSHGVGQRLAEEFCLEVARCGAAELCLTTDRDGNDRVNRFYKRMGFVVARTYVTPEGRFVNEYYKKLDFPGEPAGISTGNPSANAGSGSV